MSLRIALVLGLALTCAAVAGTDPATAVPRLASGEQLVFSSTRSDGGSDLHRLSADGTTVTRLTASPLDDSQPAVSPDGRTIAFTRGVGQAAAPNAGDLHLVGIDGTGARPLLTDPHSSDFRPAWSPDGRSLVFSRLSADGSASSLWAVGADGTGLRRLTTEPGHNNYASFAGPDRIIFNSNRDGVFKVWSMQADGSGAVAISSGPDTAPVVSTDRSQIAFRSLRNGSGIWVMGIDGSGPTQVTKEDDKFPTWSTNGAKLAFSRRDPSCPAAGGTFCPHRLHLLELATGEVATVPAPTGAVELFSAFASSPPAAPTTSADDTTPPGDRRGPEGPASPGPADPPPAETASPDGTLPVTGRNERFGLIGLALVLLGAALVGLGARTEGGMGRT